MEYANICVLCENLMCFVCNQRNHGHAKVGRLCEACCAKGYDNLCVKCNTMDSHSAKLAFICEKCSDWKCVTCGTPIL